MSNNTHVPGPLDVATTSELVDELIRRHPHGVIVMDGRADEKGDWFEWKWGDTTRTLGMMEVMAFRLKMKVAIADSRPMPEDPDHEC